MQSSETWIIQSVPVHVSSSITPRHHFFRLLGPWGENTQVLAQLPQLPRWPFRTALMQITSPDCLLRSLVSQTLRDEKDWMELSEIWQEFHVIFFVFGKTDTNGTQLVFVSLVFSYLSQHEEVGFVPLDLSKVLEVATGRRKQKKRNIRIASCCHPAHQLVPLYTCIFTDIYTSFDIFTLPPSTSTCKSLHRLLYRHIHTLWYLHVTNQHIN